MTKKELLAAAIVVLIIFIWSITALTDILRDGLAPPPPDFVKGAAGQWIGWLAILYVVGVVFYLAWVMLRSPDWFVRLTSRMTVRAAIPLIYWFAFTPIPLGFVVTVLTGEIQWVWLSCLSIPTLLLFLLVDLLKHSSKEHDPDRS